jgi:hypothetical protein
MKEGAEISIHTESEVLTAVAMKNSILVLQKSTDLSEGYVAAIFRVEK